MIQSQNTDRLRSFSTNPAIAHGNFGTSSHIQYITQAPLTNHIGLSPRAVFSQAQTRPAPPVYHSQSTDETAEFERLMNERNELTNLMQKLNEENERILKLNDMLVGKLRLIANSSLMLNPVRQQSSSAR